MTGPTTARADAIVVAAGSSSRMAGTDKLLAPLGGRPLLARTVAAFASHERVDTVVVVTRSDRRRALEADGLLGDPARVHVVEGGDRRQDSVRAGFTALEGVAPDPAGERIVLVHDGARPVVSAALIDAVIAAAARHGAAIPVTPIAETVKRLDGGERILATVERADLATAQTPQGMRRGILRDALASVAAGEGTWTDEAALLEACRIAVHAVPGDPANIKVTVPADLARVETLAAAPSPVRSGIGHDAHPFGPGAPLRLGGVTIPGAPRLHGHSDGDVVLHAVADGLLGAAGLGDLGRQFPAGPATPTGVDSAELLAGVLARLATAGWRPARVDLTITGARPRLAAYLDPMRASIAALLDIPPGDVNVKASTGNLDGAEGAGRSMSTLALVSIERAS